VQTILSSRDYLLVRRSSLSSHFGIENQALANENVKQEGATHLNKRDTTPPLAWLWRIRGVYTSRWSYSCSALHVYAAKLPHAGCAHCAHERKREMSEAKRIRSVSFRPTDEEYGEIEKANNWCRNTTLDCALRRPALLQHRASDLYRSRSSRFLIGHGIKLLFSCNEPRRPPGPH
jgi:hypothetical protein